jgi:hypothetical protein
MMLTLLTIAGTGAALTALYILIAKNQPAGVLVGETTLASGIDPAAETLVGDCHCTPTGTGADWRLTTVSSLGDAEDLLDVLENQGVGDRELVVLGNSTFAVRWR